MILPSQIVGNVGLYFACYKLSMLGWNVMPTARNARGVDIVAYSGDAKRFHGIQVKTLSKRNPVPIGPSLDKCMGDFWVILNKVASETPAAYVMLPEEVKLLAHRGEKDGRISYWLQPTSYERPEFREAWERIGHGGLDAASTDCANNGMTARPAGKLPQFTARQRSSRDTTSPLRSV